MGSEMCIRDRAYIEMHLKQLEVDNRCEYDVPKFYDLVKDQEVDY